MEAVEVVLEYYILLDFCQKHFLSIRHSQLEYHSPLHDSNLLASGMASVRLYTKDGIRSLG